MELTNQFQNFNYFQLFSIYPCAEHWKSSMASPSWVTTHSCNHALATQKFRWLCCSHLLIFVISNVWTARRSNFRTVSVFPCEWNTQTHEFVLYQHFIEIFVNLLLGIYWKWWQEQHCKKWTIWATCCQVYSFLSSYISQQQSIKGGGVWI